MGCTRHAFVHSLTFDELTPLDSLSFINLHPIDYELYSRLNKDDIHRLIESDIFS